MGVNVLTIRPARAKLTRNFGVVIPELDFPTPSFHRIGRFETYADS